MPRLLRSLSALLSVMPLLVAVCGCGGGGGFVESETAPDLAPIEDIAGPAEVTFPDSETPSDAVPETADVVVPGDLPLDAAPPVPCTTAANCEAVLEAAAPCTEWRCEDGSCVLAERADGERCDDGLVCTLDDRCEGGACTSHAPEACGDDNPCTDDRCEEPDGCVHTPNDVSCDDGDLCTVLDACVDGECGGRPSAELCPCETDPDCAVHDDGDACNGRYGCVAGGCVAAPPVDCDGEPVATCHVAACDPVTGACMPAPAPDGTPCDDGQECTVNDVCGGGRCGGTPGGCPCLDHADCEGYDDGDRCNGIFHCSTGGQCGFAPETIVVCPAASNPCRVQTCDPATGGCEEAPVGDGEACSDGSACTTGETCTGGVCGGGMPVDCDDGNPCTYDRCDVYFGCLTLPAPLDCDDGDRCTVADRCIDGACAGSARDCDDGNPCTTDYCDAEQGCMHVAAPGVCSDGNPCTEGDACFDGACAPGPVEACGGCVTDVECFAYEDGDLCDGVLRCIEGLCRPDPATVQHCDDPVSPCQLRVCNPETGACDTRNRTDGLPCDDGNPCTFEGFCSIGICVTKSNPCDDGNACTDDACDPTTGCTHTFTAGACSDGNRCTSGDQCAFGVCQPGAQSACPSCGTDDDCAPGDDQDACNGVIRCDAGRCVLAEDSLVVCPVPAPDSCLGAICDPGTGTCATEPLAEGAPCDDGDVCTTNDRCMAEEACRGESIDCDDGNPCTDDGCDPALGCRHTPNDLACDDENACTTADLCLGGRCAGTEPVRCEDGYPCTTDLCDAASGECRSEENAAPCDDGSACTAADTCRFGECVGIALSCDDANPCTDDLCDPGLGCLHNDNTGLCEDGQPCTLNDHCDNGQCLAGPLACLEICGNGEDDDDDGLADCLDSDCMPLPSCSGVGRCEPVGEIACGELVTGDLAGLGTTDENNSYSCVSGDYTGPELAWSMTAECDGIGHARLRIRTADHPERPRVTLFIVKADELGNCVAVTDCMAKGILVYLGSVAQAEALFPMSEGETYFVIADGQAGVTPDFEMEFLCYCGGM